MRPATKILRLRALPVLVAAAALGACAVVPSGPSVMVLPGTGKTFDQFRYDDAQCQQFAYSQVGGATAENAATDAAVRSAAVGTAIGAATGAAFNGSSGAGAGAAVGLLAGSMIGASTSQASGYATQARYDNAYVQCMYAAGHRVPVRGQFTAPPPGYGQGYAPGYQPNYAPPPGSAPAAQPVYVPPPPPPGSPGPAPAPSAPR